MIDLEMLVIADFLLFVYLSFESTLPHFPSRTLNDRFITTTPPHDDDDDDDDDDAWHG
mgnify:CR=1 FL=1